jgi:hypothetical protein
MPLVIRSDTAGGDDQSAACGFGRKFRSWEAVAIPVGYRRSHPPVPAEAVAFPASAAEREAPVDGRYRTIPVPVASIL